jgi:hypothetical protein
MFIGGWAMYFNGEYDRYELIGTLYNYKPAGGFESENSTI